MPRSDSFATKLLFVCSRNWMRSLPAEKIFTGIPGFEVRSAGTQPQARIVITEGHIRWADIIFVMEKAHLNRLRQDFPGALDSKRVIAPHVPDEYQFMQPELIEELETHVALHLGPWRTTSS